MLEGRERIYHTFAKDGIKHQEQEQVEKGKEVPYYTYKRYLKWIHDSQKGQDKG